ncbi:MAG: DUF6483 family protein [Oscillospiraceae bacterium]|nr:DUF6483 family protein [Oscillospiraceae bacterium]
MFGQDDYLMRMIENMAKALGQLVFNKPVETVQLFDQAGNVTEEGLLMQRLKDMLACGQVNEAENLLFSWLDESLDPNLLPVAIEFYRTVAGMDEAELAASDYTREEIAEGLAAVERLFEGNA